MLRITLETNDDGWMVRLAGRLAGEFVVEAEQVCRSVDGPLLVDATELQGVDADGLALLVEIIEGGGRVEGLSGYLAMRVDTLRVQNGA